MDNLEALEQKHKELGEEIARLKQGNVRWKPEYGDSYWFAGSWGEESVNHWENDKIDRARFALGSCFRTKEEARRKADRDSLTQELKDFAARDGAVDWSDEEGKHRLTCDRETGVWEVMSNWHMQTLGVIYFKTEERAEEAIKHFGKRLDLLLAD